MLRAAGAVATLALGAPEAALAVVHVDRSAMPAEVVATPRPARSGSLVPLLPPAGLPTAPPPDAIKPVVPQAGADRLDLKPVDTSPGGGR